MNVVVQPVIDPFQDVMSVVLPVLVISFVGAFITDLIVTHNVALTNNPSFWTYSFLVKFLPSIFFMLLFYYIFAIPFGPAIGWLFGIPIGLTVHVLWVSTYYYLRPVPNVTTKGLMAKDSFATMFAVHWFDYVAVWFLITIIVFWSNIIPFPRGPNLIPVMYSNIGFFIALIVVIIIFAVTYTFTKKRFAVMDTIPMKPDCNAVDIRNCRPISFAEAREILNLPPE